MAEAGQEVWKGYALIERVVIPAVLSLSVVLFATQEWQFLCHGTTLVCLCFILPSYLTKSLDRLIKETRSKAFSVPTKKQDRAGYWLATAFSITFAILATVLMLVTTRLMKIVGCATGACVLLWVGLAELRSQDGEGVWSGLLCCCLGVLYVLWLAATTKGAIIITRLVNKLAPYVPMNET